MAHRREEFGLDAEADLERRAPVHQVHAAGHQRQGGDDEQGDALASNTTSASTLTRSLIADVANDATCPSAIGIGCCAAGEQVLASG